VIELKEIRDDWTPNEEQAERLCNAVGLRPAEVSDLYRYEDPSKDASK
jgi:hypothetical protein